RRPQHPRPDRSIVRSRRCDPRVGTCCRAGRSGGGQSGLIRARRSPARRHPCNTDADRADHQQRSGRADLPHRARSGSGDRGGSTCVRDSGHGGGERELPDSHRVPDEYHGVRSGRLPLYRLRQAGGAADPGRDSDTHAHRSEILAILRRGLSIMQESVVESDVRESERSYRQSHLAQLESEAIYLFREAAAQFERPALLFSGGKDSIVLVHLAKKAFAPARFPFPLLHIDTGHNFDETIEYRDWLAGEVGAELLVRYVQDSIDRGRCVEESRPSPSRNALQTVTLLDALTELKVDAAMGGARRDEEKARAKERFFSHRDRFGQWDPKNQRPELWNLFNGRKNPGEHFRVFPLSNWTEMDVWQYILHEEIPLPPLYFAHPRPVVERGGVLLAETAYISLQPGETYVERVVRFRTIGDATCTGAVESNAITLDEVIREIATTRITERGA